MTDKPAELATTINWFYEPDFLHRAYWERHVVSQPGLTYDQFLEDPESLTTYATLLPHYEKAMADLTEHGCWAYLAEGGIVLYTMAENGQDEAKLQAMIASATERLLAEKPEQIFDPES